MANADNFGGLELTYRLFRSQLKRDTDALVLFAHWYLVKNGFACVIDGKKTEVLPDGWNDKEESYVVDYSHNSKGFELKVLRSDDSIIVNLLKKSNDQTATIQTKVDRHVVNHKNDFDNVYKNLNDLYELMDEQFAPLFRSDAPPPTYQKFIETTTAEHRARREPEQGREPGHDPLRVERPGIQPPTNPASIGRSDLDPFSFDPTGRGGMIFDPFRDLTQRRLPPNIPPGSVPPGARFDPFAPPDPEAMRPGQGRFSQTGEPNPDHMRAPRGFDDNMYM